MQQHLKECWLRILLHDLQALFNLRYTVTSKRVRNVEKVPALNSANKNDYVDFQLSFKLHK